MMKTEALLISTILIKCYERKPLLRSESRLLHAWFFESERNINLFEELMEKKGEEEVYWLEQIDLEVTWRRLCTRHESQKTRWFPWRTVASITLVLSTGGCWYLF
ncbi:hypothetical protein E2P86_01875 [Sphingobacterium psychroaquaticum]|uniref:hypothetical protein n=1 Tax=Sphingobacterium psychroaquaticum TaxID=561061 RepID=UPI000A1CA099|nr:hypothetical protein [Sphingobacterium psychroaquaticum]QBQ39964.1 hypothetical protein E2P86_01875 [Sphingobacterium psychroaquaticum]